MASELEIGDVRVEFVADYVLKTMKLKPDKWTKMYAVEENKQLCLEFFDKAESTTLILYINTTGILAVTHDWPASLKSKACYFVKRNKEVVAKDPNVRNAVR